MARIRTIKPEFWEHEELSALPESTHLLAAALLNYADDEGYFNANPLLIKASCSPIREPSVSIPESLRSLQTIGYIRLGSAPDGKRYGQIVHFAEHQRVSHPTPSKISSLTITWGDSENPPENLRSPPESLRPERNREQGKEQGREQGKENRSCAARLSDDHRDSPVPPVAAIPLNDGTDYPITEQQAAELQSLYPAVDIRQELRNIVGWNLANARNRKTRSGVLRHVTSWLARAQNRARPAGGVQQGIETRNQQAVDEWLHATGGIIEGECSHEKH